MITRFRVLSKDETVAQAAEETLSGFQEDFPVVDVGSVVGVVARTDLVRALARGAQDGRVRDLMLRNLASVDVSDPLAQAMQPMDRNAVHTMPVLQRGILVGLLTPRRIGEILTTRK